MRVNKKWNQKNQPRNAQQMANAVSAAIWKLAAQVLLNLENENFQTNSQSQRLDVVEELVIYLVHQADRWVIDRSDAQQREQFITALVKDLARLLDDSYHDLGGEANDNKRNFIDRCNLRFVEYAGYQYSEQEGGSFAMRCLFGDYVMQAMGDRDSKWIPDYIVGREGPEIEASLKLALSGLVKF